MVRGRFWDIKIYRPDCPERLLFELRSVWAVDDDLVDLINDELERSGYTQKVSVNLLRMVTSESRRKRCPRKWKLIKDWVAFERRKYRETSEGEFERIDGPDSSEAVL